MRSLLLLAVLAAPPLAAAPVAATGVVDPVTTADLGVVADRLREDPVYVDPSAERALTDDEADDLRGAIRRSGEPVFVAVLPSAFLDVGSSSSLPRELGERLDVEGTVAVVVGDEFRAASSTLPSGEAGRLATAAFQARAGDGTAAVLEEFVVRLPAGGASGDPTGTAGREPGRDGPGVLPVLLLAGAGGAAIWAFSRRRRRQREEREQREMIGGALTELRAHVDVLAHDVVALDEAVRLQPAANDDYAAGVQRYRLAEAALANVRTSDDVVRVRRVLDEGTYAMARARAVVDGRPVPNPPAELQRPGPHDEPALALDDDRRPVYVGGGFGGFYGPGWFPGSGLLTGMMLGSLLGGFGGFGGWGGNTVIVNESDGGGWGGGDWGGGDWGGGDWGGGGGDWGDVGGGDWS